jgi:hypothetical protein
MDFKENLKFHSAAPLANKTAVTLLHITFPIILRAQNIAMYVSVVPSVLSPYHVRIRVGVRDLSWESPCFGISPVFLGS